MSVVDDDPSPSQWLIRRQDERMLLQALRRVPLQQQLVLQLRFWEDLTGGEIAEVLRIPEPTVRTRLRRATQALKAELARLPSGQVPAHETVDDDLDSWARRLHAVIAAARAADNAAT
jgi:RNA polymerase sigma-70 factor (ECF subfamily)